MAPGVKAIMATGEFSLHPACTDLKIGTIASSTSTPSRTAFFSCGARRKRDSIALTCCHQVGAKR